LLLGPNLIAGEKYFRMMRFLFNRDQEPLIISTSPQNQAKLWKLAYFGYFTGNVLTSQCALVALAFYWEFVAYALQQGDPNWPTFVLLHGTIFQMANFFLSSFFLIVSLISVDIIFFVNSYNQLADRFHSLKQECSDLQRLLFQRPYGRAEGVRVKKTVNPDPYRATFTHFYHLKSLLQDYDRVTQEFNSLSDVLKWYMFIYVFETIPIQCIWFFLSVYLKSMPIVRIACIFAVFGITMNLMALFLSSSALNKAVSL
jgi:hypothetical protein